MTYYEKNIRSFTENVLYEKEEVSCALDLEEMLSYEDEINQNSVILICNDVYIHNIVKYEKKNDFILNYTPIRIPFYVYYDKAVFDYLIRTIDMTELFEKKRVVVLVGEDKLQQYFADYNTLLPTKVAGYNFQKITNKIVAIRDERNLHLSKIQQNLENYYNNEIDNIKERIRKKKFRILFFVTQYEFYNKLFDFYKIFLQLGYEAIIVAEERYEKRIELLSVLENYLPDVLFTFNNFRNDFPVVPSKLPMLIYFEDARPIHYMKGFDSAYGENDYVINTYPCYDTLKNTLFGKQRYREIKSLIPKPKELMHLSFDNLEEEKYQCDVAIVISQLDYIPVAKYLICYFQNDITIVERLTQFIRDMYANIYMEKNPVKTIDDMVRELENYFGEFHLSEKDWVELYSYTQWMLYYMHRFVVCTWIIEAKKYKFHIYGFGGIEIEEFAPYAKGQLTTREEMTKAIKNAKVVIQHNFHGMVSQKLPETLLAGGLMMMNRIPQDATTMSYYNEFCKERKGILFFDSKQELFDKLDYYISHPEEKEKVIQNGLEFIGDRMTCEYVIPTWIDELSKKIIDS